MEDTLFGLLILAALLLPVAGVLGIIAFFKIGGLKRRIGVLERDLGFALQRLRPIDEAFVRQGIVAPLGAVVPPQPPMPEAPAAAAQETPPPAVATEPGPAEPVAEPAPSPVPEPLPVAARVPTVAAPPPPPPPERDLESTLGTRWAVWVGGVALALGGVFLVRTSIEQGWLGPELRLVLAALLGMGLMGAGEWLRRRGLVAPIGGLAHADVPSILVAAGSSTLFATAYAAHGLYGFIGPAAAFSALVAIALGTVLLALLHAPWLAGLGLLGGYVAPLLVTSQAPSPWPVLGLVTVLAATALTLQRFRRWTLLGWMALIAHAVWGLLLIEQTLDTPVVGTLVLVTLGLAFAAGGLTTRFATVDNTPDRGDIRTALAFAGVGAVLTAVFVGLLGPETGTRLTDGLIVAWAAVAILAVGGVAVPGLRWTSVIGAVLAVVTVAAFDAIKPAFADGTLVDPRNLGVVANSAVDAVIWTAAGFAALFGIGGVIAVLRTGDARLAAASALTPVALLAIAYLRFRLLGFEVAFGIAALALAVVMAAVAETFVRRDPEGVSAFWGAAGLYGAGGAASLGIALGLLTPSGGLTLGFALAAFGIAWVTTLRPLPLLRWAALGAAVIATGLLARDPSGLWPDPQSWPIANSLLATVGLPAAALLAAALLLRRRGGTDVPVIGLEALGGSFAMSWLWLVVGDVIGRLSDTPFSDAAELGPRAVLLLGAAIAFERLAARTGSLVFAGGSRLAYGLAALAAVAALVLHPWLLGRGDVAGGRIVNELLLAYLIPGLAAVVLTRRERARDADHVLALGAELAAHLLLMAYALAEIAVLYRGPELIGRMSSAELWSYSAVGLLYGILLLGLGLVTGRRALRLASAIVLVATVGKVFLLDMAGLTGLWRALSFIGLGAVLVAIGLVYQRLLARRPAAA